MWWKWNYFKAGKCSRSFFALSVSRIGFFAYWLYAGYQIGYFPVDRQRNKHKTKSRKQGSSAAGFCTLLLCTVSIQPPYYEEALRKLSCCELTWKHVAELNTKSNPVSLAAEWSQQKLCPRQANCCSLPWAVWGGDQLASFILRRSAGTEKMGQYRKLTRKNSEKKKKERINGRKEGDFICAERMQFRPGIILHLIFWLNILESTLSWEILKGKLRHLITIAFIIMNDCNKLAGNVCLKLPDIYYDSCNYHSWF